MNRLVFALVPALTCATLAWSVLAPAAMAQEAPVVTVSDVLLKDLYEGNLPSADAEVHFEAFLAANSKFDVEIEGRGDVEAEGLVLRLFGPDGELEVTGTNKDRSKPNRNLVKWVNVKVATTGSYRFEMGARSVGAWRFRLKGTPKKSRDTIVGTEPLAVGEEAQVDFIGLAGGRIVGEIKSPGKKNKLRGQFTRVIEPDGNVLVGDDLDERGRLFLNQDGDHVAFFRNIGKEPGDWKVEVEARPPSLKRRRGFVDADGVTWKPKLEKIKPRRGFHRETELRLVLLGRDLQPGLDVRLVKNNRAADILGTDIEWISDTEVHFSVDLDTRESEDGRSVATWKVGAWNDPHYEVEGDRTTLVKDTFAFDDSVKFDSVTNSDIVLPRGTKDDTEVFVLQFSGGFQDDIVRLGFGSADSRVRDSAHERLVNYVILYVRHLFQINETTGRVNGGSVPLCFVRGTVPKIAGVAGDDYNILQIGGTRQAGDPRDPDESLDWGFVPFDQGNSARGIFRQELDSGERIGLGVRLGFLYPTRPEVAESWIEATQPLLDDPLTLEDRRYFQTDFFPFTVAEAERMKVIVLQTERVAREIAAVVAHHVAKAIGTDSGGDGPTANPTVAGEMYTERRNLEFDADDILDLQASAVPHDMPGASDGLQVPWFPLATTQQYRLPDALTGTEYFGPFSIFAGRPNAKPNEIKVGYTSSSGKPPGMTLRNSGLSGVPPLYAFGRINCGIYNLRMRFTDTVRDVKTIILWQARFFADVGKLNPRDQETGRACNDAISRR